MFYPNEVRMSAFSAMAQGAIYYEHFDKLNATLTNYEFANYKLFRNS
ncbi:MAG: hypothetical protein HY738_19280 [Bacteroidia bacterium]|nr:hypothetical protein [Bacteroidia bacterium]